jgi:MYXO-CTERM domain-containing protein
MPRTLTKIVLAASFSAAALLGWGTAQADLVAPPVKKEECTIVAKVKELGRKCELCETDCETKYPKHGDWFKACSVVDSAVAVYCLTDGELTPEQVTAIVEGADPATVYAGNLGAASPTPTTPTTPTSAESAPPTATSTTVEAKAKAQGAAAGGCGCDASADDPTPPVVGMTLLVFTALSLSRRRVRR